jgi:hypothetical protein
MPPAVAGAVSAYPTVEDTVGQTPLVRLQRLGRSQLAARGNTVLCKLEGAPRAHACALGTHGLLAAARDRPGARSALRPRVIFRVRQAITQQAA